MKACISIYGLLVFYTLKINGFEVIKNNYGHFITGHGCGISTPIKTLPLLPRDIDNHPCTIVPFQNENLVDSDRIISETGISNQ